MSARRLKITLSRVATSWWLTTDGCVKVRSRGDRCSLNHVVGLHYLTPVGVIFAQGKDKVHASTEFSDCETRPWSKTRASEHENICTHWACSLLISFSMSHINRRMP